jgi:hypothetical protein
MESLPETLYRSAIWEEGMGVQGQPRGQAKPHPGGVYGQIDRNRVQISHVGTRMGPMATSGVEQNPTREACIKRSAEILYTSAFWERNGHDLRDGPHLYSLNVNGQGIHEQTR